MKLQAKLMLSMALTAFFAVLASMIVALALGARSVGETVEEKLRAVLEAR